MYKVLIADDEKMIREGIQRLIPWNRIGVEEVLIAASGKEALELYRREHPQILLIDICMPGMTGLELLATIRKTDPDLRVLILTGYDSFEYAQKSLRLQAQDFLLKPIDEEKLTAALKRQVAALEKSVKERSRQRVLSRAQGLSDQMDLESILRSLVHSRSGGTEPEKTLQSRFGSDPDQTMQVALVLPVLTVDKGWKENSDLLRLSMKNVCMELLDALCQGVTFDDDDGKIVLVFFVRNEFDEVVDRAQQLNSRLKDEFGSAQKVVLGSVVHGCRQLFISYNDAVFLLGKMNGYDDILQPQGTERRLDSFNDCFAELKRAICAEVGNTENVLRVFASFECSTESYNLSHSYVRRCCFDIAANFYFAYVGETGCSLDNKLISLLGSLQNCGREEACRLTREFLIGLIQSEDRSTDEIVGHTMAYIRDNLSENLSVSSLAAQFYLTPNYFSRLFKKVKGEGCNEYIARKRVEKAKSLLETTNIKTGQISAMVGYRDANYFSLSFKKYTGVSPTAYREAARNKKIGRESGDSAQEAPN